MNNKSRFYCPRCEIENIYPRHPVTAFYCHLCGEKLTMRVKILESMPEPIITEEATKIILTAIDKMREHERKIAEYEEKEKRKIFKKERNFYKNVISTNGLRLIKEIEDGYILISVIKEDPDQITSGNIIAQYATENVAGGEDLWDDLTAILMLPPHPDMTEWHFKHFRIMNKPYSVDIDDVIYEGGEPYAK